MKRPVIAAAAIAAAAAAVGAAAWISKRKTRALTESV